MHLSSTTFVTVTDSAVCVSANSKLEVRIALKELQLKKKEFGLLKRSLALKMKELRAEYTREVRSRGSMMRGGGGFGRFIRAMQTMSRDNRRCKLASDLAPFQRQIQYLEALIRAIEEAALRLQADLLRM